MKAWRLLKLDVKNAFANMAIDEAILLARMRGIVPNTIRFYRWKPSAVSIGRFQEVSKEVYVENCRKYGVDIVRRISGGGTVYHDYEGEITYSVIVDESELGSRDIVSTYNLICNGLIEAARILDVKADFNPGNPKQCPNITINGKKFSGSAQSRRGPFLLQHGTFLVDVDLKKMFTFLRVPWAKSISDVLPVAERKITSIRRELNSSISLMEAYKALVKGFKKALNIELVEGELTSYELKLAEKLRREKYEKDSWNIKGIETLKFTSIPS